MFLLFSMLPKLVIAFLPRIKCLLLLWLQSPSVVILEPKEIKPVTFNCVPIYLPWSHGTRCHDLSFWMLSFKPAFWLSSFTFIKMFFSSSSLSAISHLHIWGYWNFSLQSWFQCVLHPVCMMYSAYQLKKQSNNIQLWGIPFPIWKQSIVPCLVLIISSWLCHYHHYPNHIWPQTNLQEGDTAPSINIKLD